MRGALGHVAGTHGECAQTRSRVVLRENPTALRQRLLLYFLSVSCIPFFCPWLLAGMKVRTWPWGTSDGLPGSCARGSWDLPLGRVLSTLPAPGLLLTLLSLKHSSGPPWILLPRLSIHLLLLLLSCFFPVLPVCWMPRPPSPAAGPDWTVAVRPQGSPTAFFHAPSRPPLTRL